jgi:TonB family protein
MKFRSAPIILVMILFTAQKGMNAKKELTWPCHDNFPVSRGANGGLTWFTTDEAVKMATHCEPPLIPGVARTARLEGSVIVEIAVAPDGTVSCSRVIQGHPILKQSAVDAAKRWVFRPMTTGSANVGFLARLVFHYSTTGTKQGRASKCLTARSRWPPA